MKRACTDDYSSSELQDREEIDNGWAHALPSTTAGLRSVVWDGDGIRAPSRGGDDLHLWASYQPVSLRTLTAHCRCCIVLAGWEDAVANWQEIPKGGINRGPNAAWKIWYNPAVRHPARIPPRTMPPSACLPLFDSPAPAWIRLFRCGVRLALHQWCAAAS